MSGILEGVVWEVMSGMLEGVLREVMYVSWATCCSWKARQSTRSCNTEITPRLSMTTGLSPAREQLACPACLTCLLPPPTDIRRENEAGKVTIIKLFWEGDWCIVYVVHGEWWTFLGCFVSTKTKHVIIEMFLGFLFTNSSFIYRGGSQGRDAQLELLWLYYVQFSQARRQGKARKYWTPKTHLTLLTKYKVIFTKNESNFFMFSHRPLLIARSTFPVWCPSLCRLQAAPPPPRAMTRQCNALYVDWTRRCDLPSSYTAIINL